MADHGRRNRSDPDDGLRRPGRRGARTHSPPIATPSRGPATSCTSTRAGWSSATTPTSAEPSRSAGDHEERGESWSTPARSVDEVRRAVRPGDRSTSRSASREEWVFSRIPREQVVVGRRLRPRPCASARAGSATRTSRTTPSSRSAGSPGTSRTTRTSSFDREQGLHRELHGDAADDDQGIEDALATSTRARRRGLAGEKTPEDARASRE
jgi:hypothetical protein